MINVEERAGRLKNLGFSTASDGIKKLAEKKRKLMIAYEHYRFVRQEKINEFNNKLEKETRHGYDYKTLAFTPVKDYKEVPPDHVLLAMEEAMGRRCFDYFEIAHIIRVKDPILFGRINECSDRFFIDQWDDDVSIQDILKDNEG